MEDLDEIECYFQSIIGKLSLHLPEGMTLVHLPLLHQFELLDFSPQEKDELFLSQYFKMVETEEKVTIINDDFIVWIIPSGRTIPRFTRVLIALNRDPFPRLEAGFVASGVYNSSRLVVRVLERFLKEIKENEELIDYFQEVI